MANSFTFLYPYIDKMIQEVPFEAMAPLVLFDKDLEPAGGLTGRVPTTKAMTASAFTPSMNNDTGNSGTVSGINYTVDQVYESNFHIKYNEGMALGSRMNEVVGSWTQQAVRAVLKAIESGFYASGVNGSLYGPGCPSVVGTAGTTPFATPWGDLTNVTIALNRHLCPQDGRVGVLDLAAWANVLNATGLTHVGEAGNSETLRAARPGRLFNFDIALDTLTPTFYCSGTPTSTGYVASSGATSGGSGMSSGSIQYDIYLTGDQGKWNPGDIFWFSGSTGYGMSHVVTEAVTFTTGGTGTVKFWPGFNMIPGLTEVQGTGMLITVYTGTRRQNIFGHRSAYRLVMRDPRAGMAGLPQLGESVLYVDPRTRVPLLITFQGGDLMATIKIKAMWTWVPVRPEWSCILAG